MSPYADTTFLASLYLQDVHSPKVAARMRSEKSLLPVCWLHRVELRNAISLRVFWKNSTAGEAASYLACFEQDLRDGVYAQPAVDLVAVTLSAERLSDLHTPGLGVRSLDVLHVANALFIGSKEFLTFDTRQASLAKAAGLKVPKL